MRSNLYKCILILSLFLSCEKEKKENKIESKWQSKGLYIKGKLNDKYFNLWDSLPNNLISTNMWMANSNMEMDYIYYGFECLLSNFDTVLIIYFPCYVKRLDVDTNNGTLFYKYFKNVVRLGDYKFVNNYESETYNGIIINYRVNSDKIYKHDSIRTLTDNRYNFNIDSINYHDTIDNNGAYRQILRIHGFFNGVLYSSHDSIVLSNVTFCSELSQSYYGK